MNSLQWITDWFKAQCNGDWEHENQIKIFTIDNPGWVVKINLRDTDLENIQIDYELHELSENDWYGFSVKNSLFDAGGDLNKLPLLLDIFKQIAEGKYNWINKNE